MGKRDLGKDNTHALPLGIWMEFVINRAIQSTKVVLYSTMVILYHLL